MINTTKDLIPLRGTFSDETGAPMPAPGEDDCFPICGGSWPGSFQRSGAGAVFLLQGFVAISPKGHTLHLQNPTGRPVFCSECFVEIVKCLRTLEGKP
jgi:hypothetical protein